MTAMRITEEVKIITLSNKRNNVGEVESRVT